MYKGLNERPVKNKAQTMRKLINGVAEVFRTDGYAGLGVNKVAKIAGVNKKLIYRYFRSFNNLVEAYVVETDYWMQFAENMRQLTVPKDLEDTKRLISNVLKNQFLYFHRDKEMQELILWELSSDSELMRSIHRTREAMGQQFLELTDPYLNNADINFRAVAALIVGGIYYTILHTRYNGGMFSDLDLSTDSGREDILNAIDQVIDMVFDRSLSENN
ncbi:TetR/AcrR family transcriptional regulator [Mucilaginibacter sp. ZT4R22]|uniref:TetR/AcrR family transcriptional regulator n=1 Tax=Mucilaginibacter pankratovii TaxID=2772110 RepID=A0ABR7WKT4_9SPHI|nr:TetR/AcrR family transcriptional regulator [Mucilaginibacter pankratovii]MBD1362938.1 TetR/AcrR family transcriptional regulator [Mucilaginibacter pankratovii]